jgi:hypothetical protein
MDCRVDPVISLLMNVEVGIFFAIA